jgi:hypothetical protein
MPEDIDPPSGHLAEHLPGQALALGGCSFQFGRTSILFPRLPHLAQTTLRLKYGTSVSAE